MRQRQRAPLRAHARIELRGWQDENCKILVMVIIFGKLIGFVMECFGVPAQKVPLLSSARPDLTAIPHVCNSVHAAVMVGVLASRVSLQPAASERTVFWTWPKASPLVKAERAERASTAAAAASPYECSALASL